MAFDKAIRYGKTKRKPYRDSRRFDSRCRNNGRCGYCRGNRLHSVRIRQESAQSQIETEREQ